MVKIKGVKIKAPSLDIPEKIGTTSKNILGIIMVSINNSIEKGRNSFNFNVWMISKVIKTTARPASRH